MRSKASSATTTARTSSIATIFPCMHRIRTRPPMSDSSIRAQALACRDAAQTVAALSTDAKNALLRAMADALQADADAILAANAGDLRAAEAKGIGSAMLDRLMLDPQRLAGIADALREVAELPDPVGLVTRRDVRPNGIAIERVRVPLGVIAMIYEARPNVTADAAALCIKAGNGVILRGGSEAVGSNMAIVGALERALCAHGVPTAAITLIDDLRRETMVELLQLNDIVDLAIPRGGEGLIRFVAEHARVPVIKHYKGVCHLYVDAAADPDLALDLLLDGKVARPSACNALETLLVHAEVAADFLPRAAAMLRERGVELRGDARTCALIDTIPATDADWDAEFLDLILAVRVVDSLDDAIAHIRRHGSDHTEVIATGDEAAAARFVHALRSAVVMVNASSRFSDGGELGLGAEIGISTTRLHAYGPMGAESLTIERFVVRGMGQTRNLSR
ncbi:MAG: glutamate-5-semialdehyde dehydrogenase [Xanthomonadales bacterium]|nr:glutamate-5-semialdehyde dehydrogenase [Xanthomonadales bacterium]